MTDKINIVGYPGYMTDGLDVYSFKRYPDKPLKKKWFKLREVEITTLRDDEGHYRHASRRGLKHAYENQGVLPEPGSLLAPNPKRKQFRYMLDGKQVSVKQISTLTGMSESTIRVRMHKSLVLNYGIYTFTKVLKN